MFLSLQDSDASTAASLCGSRPRYTQKAERRSDRRSSLSARQRRVNGYAVFCFLIIWEPSTQIFLLWSCLLHEMASPPVEEMEEWRPVWIPPLVEPTNTLFLYMFFVFPLFSLSTCVPGPACYGCVLCCRFIWYLPSPGCGSNELKTTANMGLLNGFLFCFVLSLCLPPPFFSLSLCLPCLSLSYLRPSFCFSLSLCFYCALTGVQEEVCEKKSKVVEDASGLVPYGGDSSDEEEERTHSSKTDNS